MNDTAATYQLTIGPQVPAWCGQQRFQLRLADERVTDVDYQLEPLGAMLAEQLAEATRPSVVLRLAARGGVAHTIAACHAIEKLCSLAPSRRAADLRAALAELERAASHAAAIAAILRTAGLDGRAVPVDAIAADIVTLTQQLSNTDAPADLIAPGGLTREPGSSGRSATIAELPRIAARLFAIAAQLIDHRALIRRTVQVGAISRTAAEQYALRGPLARACGLERDARADTPGSIYARLGFKPITQDGGDVYARLALLLLEAVESLKLTERLLRELEPGEVLGQLAPDLPSGEATGIAEGPQGAVRYSLASDGRAITDVRVDTPRQIDRLLARTLLSGALLDNIPLIVASLDIRSL